MSVEYVPLRYVTSVLARGTAPNYVDDGPVRVVSQAANQDSGLDWERSRFHDFAGDPRKLKGHLKYGDSVVNSTGTGTLGRVGWFEESPDGRACVADGHVTVTRFDPTRVDKRFGFYYLKSDEFQEFMFETLVNGSTNQIELSRERMSAVSMPVPPLDEQRRIADFLDAETARIDKISVLLRDFESQVRHRERSALGIILNAGVTRADAELPSGWKWLRLMFLADPYRPIMYGIVLPGPNVASGVPIVKGGDVAADRLSVETLSRTTYEIESRYERSRLQGGDLVIAIRGSVGEVAMVPDTLAGANLTQDAARIAASDDVDKGWLRLVLQSPIVQNEIRSRITGATIKGINIWDLERILVPTPPTMLQREHAKQAQKELDLHENLVEKRRCHVALLAERRQALITAAVTGEFDVSAASGRGIEE